ncbi:MAG: MBL fold metallo-hydrolase [Alphaproteobacteria bacterium]|nr:MBL fold metallo-hydrolase [Alphaproteobacteria bacterium]
MLFRQLYENVSSTFTYLLADGPGGEALIIDPVFERVERYLTLFEELDVRLVMALDTHVHADHITGLAALRDRTKCITAMGKMAKVDVVSFRFDEGDTVEIEGVRLDVMYTPGHTDDSYCFRMPDRVFTGDTLLIRGTGRTDFQNGDPRAAYHSLVDKLLKLPDETLVYPGHDYKGDSVSTIAEERAFNPRLKVASADEYAALMQTVNMPNPKMMDVAVPANLKIGARQRAEGGETWSIEAATAISGVAKPDVVLIDLRDDNERRRAGAIPNAVQVPYRDLVHALHPGGLVHHEAIKGRKRIMFYCAFGERSALAVKSAHESGLFNVCHIVGGIEGWRKAGGAIEAIG